MTRTNNLAKTFLLLWLFGSLIALITHLFFPDAISNLSLWNASIGWQREIALWNLSIAIIIIYMLIKDDIKTHKNIVIVLTTISFLLGTNHLITLLMNKSLISLNLLGFLANYIILILGIYIIGRNKR
jgi:hypothetical protein